MSLLLNLSEVAKFYGAQEVFTGVGWQINDRLRTALVGRNGAGKTTLFRLLAGQMEPDRGTIWRRPGSVVAIMEQDQLTDDGRTLRDEANRGLTHVHELESEFADVTSRMGGIAEDDPDGSALLERYAYLEERLHREGVYSAEARIGAVLDGLHFTESDLDRPLAQFSGGQKSRAALARVLLRDPDLLLLDEPTNHLDLDAIEWLEGFLGSYQGALILVSHDRVFLNRLSDETVELRNGKLTRYPGNYDAFLVERERRLEDQAKRYELQQDEIRRTQVFIQKNIAGQKTKQAQSRRNWLERLERLEAPEWPASSIRMSLPDPERSARVVVEAKELAKSYGTLPVFRGVSFLVQRGQKVGLVGPNGVGKTTLLKLIIGQESQNAGVLRIGSAVDIGYYAQEQDELRGTQSVLEEIWRSTPQVTETEMRTFLGSFLFHGDDVFKGLNQLSGGERSRVALAKLVRRGANFLVLDEPTNHLDLESRAVIEAALRAFRGTVLVASHDRAFLGSVVEHILEVRADGSRFWEGGYERYAVERRRRREGETVAAASAPPKPGGPAKPAGPAKPGGPPPAAASSAKPVDDDKELRRRQHEESKQRKREEERLRRRLDEAEATVGDVESRLENLRLHMADPALATDSERLGELHADVQAQERALAEAIAEWERLAARLEAFLDAPNP